MARYIFLAVEQRCHDDPKTIGSLFFTCNEEIIDLSLIKALQRLFVHALDKVRSSGEFAEDDVFAMINAIMGAAFEFIKTSRRLAVSSVIHSIS